MKMFQSIAALLIVFLVSVHSIIAQIVSVSDAQTAGFYFLSQLNENIKTQNELVLQQIQYTSVNEPAWYLFEIPSKGFIIVSAEKLAHPIIAYSTDEPLPQNGSLPPSYAFWMQQRTIEIEEIRTLQHQASAETIDLWSQLLNGSYQGHDLKTKNVQPLLKSAWNQDCRYNEMCPVDAAGPCGRVYAGCVATAMGQIMYYWRFPQTGNGSMSYNAPPYGTQTANFGATTYKWDEMKGSINTSHPELAKLLYHAAVSVYMNFSPSGSGANSEDVPSALKNRFRYASANYRNRVTYTSANWNALIKGNIDNKYPVYYSGSGNNGGHAFICDGYQGSDYFHFDWGWSGAYNGYYYLNNLNPGNNTFNNWQAAVVDIYPPAASYPVSCSGQKTLTAISGSFDDGSGPIANYQPNTNCSWLIKPSSPVDYIKLNFVYLDTEASNDVITVYNGETTSAPILGTFSGNSLPGYIQSTGESMLVTFTSNSNTQLNGFLAEYYAVPSKFCSGTVSLTDPSGVIEDGSGPDYQYLNSANCKWIIEPPLTTSVHIVFTEFDTEPVNDKVKIMNLDNGSTVAEYSGNSIPAPITVQASRVMIFFTSNTSVQGNGWALNYTTITNIEEPANAVFSLYPNPANDFITLQGMFSTTSEVQIHDLSGRLCFHKQFQTSSPEYQLDISSLNPGIYILELRTSDNAFRFKLTVY